MSVEQRTVITRVVAVSSESVGAEGHVLTVPVSGYSDHPIQSVHLVPLRIKDGPAREDRVASRIPPTPPELSSASAAAQLRQVCEQYQNDLAVLVQPQGARTMPHSTAVSAGAGVVIADAEGPTTTIDFIRRRPVIRVGRDGHLESAWGRRGAVVVRRSAGRIELHVRLSAKAGGDYERALRLSSDPESFLDNVALRSDRDGAYLSLRLRPTGRVPLRRASHREVPVSWDGEEAAFDFDPRHGINSLVLRHELDRRGIQSDWISKNSLVAEHNGEEVAFHVTSSPRTAQTAAMVTDDKDVTRTVLQSVGISVARGRHFFDENDLDEALEFFRELPSVVVKPVRGTKGRGVTVDIDTEEGFREAWAHAFHAVSGGVLVEEHFHGTEVRFLIVGGACIAAALRLPPQVRGDGQSTIRQLVTAKNRQRRTNPHLANRPIVFDSARLNRLQAHGLTLHSVLEVGQDYIIDHKGGFSTGAESRDVTDLAHPSYLDAAARAADAIPGLPISGVDILVHDLEHPAAPENHIILELNSQPGIGGHHFPVYGEPRNVGGALVDLVLADRADTTPERPIPFELSQEISDQERDPDTARMAEEFETAGFELIWLNRFYFVARRGDRQTTVWGTYTHLTGKNALVATRSPRNAEVMLARKGVPQLRKAVFVADQSSEGFLRGREAMSFAKTLGDVSLRCQTLEPHTVRAGDERRFRSVWNRLSQRHGSVVVEERPSGTLVRFLVAYGRILGVLARTSRGHRDLTEELAGGYTETALAAAAAFPGLDLCEVQMTIRDASIPARGDDHWVGIVRAKPALRPFERPDEGIERNLAREIVRLHVERLLASRGDARPTPLVTGGRSLWPTTEMRIDRVHAVEYDETEPADSEGRPTFLVRIHATTDGGKSVIGEGLGAADRTHGREPQRQAWRALTQSCRGLRKSVRTLTSGAEVQTQLRPILPEGPDHEAARLALIRAAEDLFRRGQDETDAQRPFRYPQTLHRARRRVWSPRLEPAQTPNGLPVNDHDEQINLAGSSLSYSSFLLQQEALRRGLGTARYTRGDFTSWDAHGQGLTFWRSLADTESPVSEYLCDHKQLTRQLLVAGGVPTAQGRVFDQDEVEEAVRYAASMGYPVVVKPQKGRKGRGVVTDISDAQELREAISALSSALQESAPFIVERHLKGQDYRIYVAFGEVVSVVLRRPASVIGDGVRTVAELVAAKNALRLQSTHTRTRLMKADASAERMLRRQGLDWDAVLDEGREAVLASVANISQGGDSIEVIDETHPSLLEAAVRSVRAIPGLNQAGVDFLMPDHALPVDGQGGGVCEINALASLMASQAPFVGPTQPVAARVLELSAAERGLELTAPTDHLCVRVRCEGVPDTRALTRWLTRQGRQLGLRGGPMNDAHTSEGSDSQMSVTALIAGPAPVVMRFVSGTTVGPVRRRPSVVSVTPTVNHAAEVFEEKR